MAKEKKNRFWYSERQASLDDDVWDKNRQFTFVKTPEGYKLYSEWCSIKGTRCNWEDAELVYETDDEPEVIVHNGVPGLIADLQKQLSESNELRIATKWKVDDLEKQLAEKEKERHEEWLTGKEWKWECDRLKRELHTANQETLHFQNKYFAEKQIAIAELEKVKEYWLKHEDIGYYIDQQIKELKGEK